MCHVTRKTLACTCEKGTGQLRTVTVFSSENYNIFSTSWVWNNKPLAICSVLSHLVRNPVDRFSHDAWAWNYSRNQHCTCMQKKKKKKVHISLLISSIPIWFINHHISSYKCSNMSCIMLYRPIRVLVRKPISPRWLDLKYMIISLY